MDEKKISRWTLRPSFLLGIGVCLIVLVGYPVYLMMNAEGGRVESSPDGRSRLSVFGPLEPQAGDSWRLHLVDIENGGEKTLLRMTIQPDASTIVSPRGRKDLIQWSSRSDYVEIVVEGKRIVRIFVPGRDTLEKELPKEKELPTENEANEDVKN